MSTREKKKTRRGYDMYDEIKKQVLEDDLPGRADNMKTSLLLMILDELKALNEKIHSPPKIEHNIEKDVRVKPFGKKKKK